MLKVIASFKEELKTAAFPEKEILHSCIAELYFSYYQQNRYQFLNRTHTVDFDQKDIDTWDLRKIMNTVIKHYTASLENSDKLYTIKLEEFKPILISEKNSLEYRPSLYDFLAHRALNFFINTESGLTEAKESFDFNNPAFLSYYTDFVKLDIKTTDSLSLKYYAFDHFQRLIRIHSKDKDAKAFVDAELKRLNYYYSKLRIENKDSLYIQNLQKLEKEFAKSEAVADIKLEIANFWYAQGNKYNAFTATEYQWLIKKAKGIYENIVEKYPKSGACINAKYKLNIIEKTSFSIVLNDANIPNTEFLGYLSYKNAKETHFRVVKTDYFTYQKLSDKYYGEDFINKLIKLQAVKEWSIQIPDEGDYQTHSVEFPIPALDYGFYLLLAADDESFDPDNTTISYGSFWITNIAFSYKQKENYAYEFYICNRKNGKALEGVNVKQFKQKYNYQIRAYERILAKNYKTDANGFFEVDPLRANANSSYSSFEFTNGKDSYIPDQQIYQYAPYERSKRKLTKTFFFIDRGIYRPGQSLYFKGIVMEYDENTEKYEILENHKTTVALYDVNYQKVSELKLTSNEYGSISGSFELPMGVMNGQMRIDNGSGNKYFSVEEYKRPQFEVKINKAKGTYKLNENVVVTGNAKSYAGHNIDGAEVKYRITRSARYPYRFYWWSYNAPPSAEKEIANGFTKTDEKGEFSIDFTAIPDYSVDKKYKPVFYYKVTADVTDLNGETHSASSSVPVGYSALFVDVSIPDKINKREKENKFHIRTENLSGIREKCKGTIKIHRLKQAKQTYRERNWSRPDKHLLGKEEFYKRFPLDQYDDENNKYSWEKEKEVLEYFFDTEKDTMLNLSVCKGWKSGHYVLEITSEDKYGQEVNNMKYFHLFDTKDKQVSDNALHFFEDINISGEPGEKVEILLASAANNMEYLYEVEHQGKIVKRDKIILNNEQKLIEIPIKEEHRGGFSLHFIAVKDNRSYSHSSSIYVPYTNKQLEIEFQTFRNKLLPGEEEEWKLTLKGKNGDRVAAEMLATLYDASLDAFASNSWSFNIYKHYYSTTRWNNTSAFQKNSLYTYSPSVDYFPQHIQKYDALNWFGMPISNFYYGYYDYDYIDDGEVYFLSACESSNRESGRFKNGQSKMAETRTAVTGGMVTDEIVDAKDAPMEEKEELEQSLEIGDKTVEGTQIRSNFNETAFFYPHLQTNEKGEIVIKFVVPESLTRWKMMGFAHTKDLEYGFAYNELVTQKELMIIPNAPRFFRENDKMQFTAKISNISDKDLEGVASIEILDAITMKPLTSLFSIKNPEANFSVEKGLSTVVSWEMNIPENIGAVTYRVVAKAGNFSDGEEKAIPVLTNRMLVTESLPLPIRGNTSKTFQFTKLLENKSTTLTHHRYTLEMTSNPAWYAIQALPYMMEYPYECSEQIFSRFYANSIAHHIANSNPKIKAVFDSWKASSPDAFLSNLEKNQELKSLLLEETPWVLDAKNESERKKRVALLFDFNKMARELDGSLRKLQKVQSPNGGFPWFKGMRDNRYITQHIVTGFGHLDHLGIVKIREDKRTWKMIQDAVRYLDLRIKEDYEYLLKYDVDLSKDHISQTQIQYLYARSYFLNDFSIPKSCSTAFDYYKGQAIQYWLNKSIYMQGMISLALHRLDEKTTPMDIIKSLKEKSITNEEMGMYWRDLSAGYYWYQAPIETQALLIECFDEVADDQESVEEMKIWLLKQKQTQDWKTTKATAEACYALLLKGTDILSSDELVEIEIGGQRIDPNKIDGVKVQAGTGYFKTAWAGAEIKNSMGEIKLTKHDEGIAWGAVYWQYFEQLDKITPAETPLKLEKKLFVERNSDSGPILLPINEKTTLKVGDKVKVRIELRVDRDMEYVHMKDMRASCFEPTNVISRYKYQGGIGYYESTKDASTNFFIDYLKKGSYVFEYPLLVTHKGNFSNGITSIQCMYAPEFSSHSEGIRVEVK